MSRRPVVWSIAGNDSGGGAGLAADLRAAEAFGVHLCPVVAAVTAQNSLRVARVAPVGLEMLDAQLAALEDDLRPAAVKTGVLAHWAQVECVARWVDRLREQAPVALVVDPVLRASSGSALADGATARAYRELLLPRADIVTPNHAEAAKLLDMSPRDAPAMARALQRIGARSVCVTGGDEGSPRALDWMATPQAAGWLAASRVPTAHGHGTGCSFATATASALALGFADADALVLAKMAVTQGLEDADPAGRGPGPVRLRPGFAMPHRLPTLSWGEAPLFPGAQRAPAAELAPLGLYAIVDSPQRVDEVLAAGARTVQLRMKGEPQDEALRAAISACRGAGAQLFINDHWEAALRLGAPGLHLGQEDLLALDDAQRLRLVDAGIALGVSTHSLWELCRAMSLRPRYVACGPVWPTPTKSMPWRPQGLHNLAWWCAMAGAPVVAIGGVVDADRVRAAAACGADGVCVLRALEADAARVVPAFEAAWREGCAVAAEVVAALPRPTL